MMRVMNAYSSLSSLGYKARDNVPVFMGGEVEGFRRLKKVLLGMVIQNGQVVVRGLEYIVGIFYYCMMPSEVIMPLQHVVYIVALLYIQKDVLKDICPLGMNTMGSSEVMRTRLCCRLIVDTSIRECILPPCK